MPRNASFAPSSTMTRSGFSSATTRSTRATPPAVVSPETPALTSRAGLPCARKRAWSCAGKAACGETPSPAVKLSPNTRITVLPEAAAASRNSEGDITHSTAQIARVPRRNNPGCHFLQACRSLHSFRIRRCRSQRADDLLCDQFVTGSSKVNAVIGPQAFGHPVTILAEGSITALVVDDRRP